MRNFVRHSQPGDICFITTVTKNRTPVFIDRKNISLLLQTMKEVQAIKKVRIISYVILPDHLHLIIQSDNFSTSEIMHSIKWNFTRNWKLLNGDKDVAVSPINSWQPRFWEHIIVDNDDLYFYINYIINNPVKHGYVEDADDWPYSSFTQHILNEDWGVELIELSV